MPDHQRPERPAATESDRQQPLTVQARIPPWAVTRIVLGLVAAVLGTVWILAH